MLAAGLAWPQSCCVHQNPFYAPYINRGDLTIRPKRARTPASSCVLVLVNIQYYSCNVLWRSQRISTVTPHAFLAQKVPGAPQGGLAHEAALPPPPPPSGATTQLLFDYPGHPGHQDKLAVSKGTTVQVSSMADHANQWLLVVHGGQQGYVPRAYTELGRAGAGGPAAATEQKPSATPAWGAKARSPHASRFPPGGRLPRMCLIWPQPICVVFRTRFTQKVD